MSEQKRIRQIAMRRHRLDDLPPVVPPEGYRIRHYRPGDGAVWSTIIAEAFGKTVPPDYFERHMRRHPAFRPERILFIEGTEGTAGTASAWYQPGFSRRMGMLHWVAVRPQDTGRHLGYWVSLAALHRLAQDGRQGAFLTTDDHRLAAIKTYLRLGFEPLILDEDQPDRWRAIFQALGEPQLAEHFREALEAPVYQPEQEYPDTWDLRLLRPRRLWHPDRPPRWRPSGAGTIDALGDESLYRPSALGRAGMDVASVPAGSRRPFSLWFCVGEQPLEAGAVVRFCMRGQRPLGGPLQDRSPDQPGYVEIEGPPHARLEREGLGFRVAEGALQSGDVVGIHVGRRGGFHWTPLAGRREFKVIVETHPEEPLVRLPEPVVVRVEPLEPERLEVLLPGTCLPGSTLEATLSLRDRFDNRVAFSGVAEVRLEGHSHRVPLVDGFSRLRLPAPARVARALATCSAVPGAFLSNPCVPHRGWQLFFGDLHCHDFLSEAEGALEEVYRWAREDRRLDFVSVSHQSHGCHSNDTWTLVKYMNERFLEEGRFVTFLGFEWQHSHYGDKVVHYLGGDQPYLPVDDPRYNTPAKLYEALRASDALVISHHPAYPRDQHVPGTDWKSVETDVDRLVEIWSMHGSSEGYDLADRPPVGMDPENTVMGALRAGLRIGFVAGSDTHSGRPCGSAREPRPYWGGMAAVWAEALTRRSIFEALRARRTVALTGARIFLWVTVNGHPMGAEIPLSEEAIISVRIHAPEKIARIEILRNTEVIHVECPASEECHLEYADRTEGAPCFYHVRVTQEDGHLAVCSPVWLG